MAAAGAAFARAKQAAYNHSPSWVTVLHNTGDKKTTADDNHQGEQHPNAEDEPAFEADADALEIPEFVDADRVSEWLAGIEPAVSAHDLYNLQQYLLAIGRNRLLDHEHELRLAAQMRAPRRLAVLNVGRSKDGQPPAPADVLAALYDDLTLDWRRWQEVARVHPQAPVSLGQWLREAQALRVNWDSEQPSTLYRWLNEGPWGQAAGAAGQPVAHLAWEVFVAFYMFPTQVQNGLSEYLNGQPRYPAEALWPTALTFRSWLPAEADIQAEFDQMNRRADEASQRLVEANLRLVASLARRHGGRGVNMLDRIQAGNTGLLRAEDKFDPAGGHKFSTYAAGWIRQAITCAISA